MRFPASYAIVIGSLIIVQWLFFIFTGNVTELRSETIRVSFHLAAEFLTAFLLFVGGIAGLHRKPAGKPILFFAFGMLFYSVNISPGYFAEKGQWIFFWMFAVILILAAVSVFRLVRHL